MRGPQTSAMKRSISSMSSYAAAIRSWRCFSKPQRLRPLRAVLHVPGALHDQRGDMPRPGIRIEINKCFFEALSAATGSCELPLRNEEGQIPTGGRTSFSVFLAA